MSSRPPDQNADNASFRHRATAIIDLVASAITFLASLGNKWIASLDVWVKSLVVGGLKVGAIPRHVAFIMDGNRRFAKRSHLRRHEGHLCGFRTLESTLEWCLSLGITSVTCWAMSIDNLRSRDKEEIAFLFDLAEKKLVELARNCETVRRHQVGIRVVGDLTLLPETVRNAAKEAMWLTRNYHRGTLTVLFPYAARFDMHDTYTRFLSEARQNPIVRSEIYNPGFDFSSCFLSPPRDSRPSPNSNSEKRVLGPRRELSIVPPVDIVVRTGGDHRLSDFLNSECTTYGCQLHFVKRSWPEFRFWDMVPIILEWQLTSRSR